MATLKELSHRQPALTAGHRMCAGCVAPVIVKIITLASPAPVVVGCATGCLEVATTIFPYTAWKCSFVHNAFENAAATVSGVETAYRALKKRGRVSGDMNFVTFGGDGGTYDIGLQSLSGAMERGHNMLYVCYDNEAYMNTGVQRSGATPMGAATTTCPAGSQIKGKMQFRKDLTGIMVAHGIPYVAQGSPGHWQDLIKKAEKAFSIKGPKFMNVLMPCNLGWGYLPDQGLEFAKLAVETCFWPLFEVENGKYKINYIPKEKKPITEFYKSQRRFAHLFKPENKEILETLQARIDKTWNDLLSKAS